MKIYNTLSNKIEEFLPINPPNVNMYVCGPTVYNDIHIGNARPVVFFDTLKRFLTYLGYNVHYASNITDVDDRIINKAKSLNKNEKYISTKYTNHYLSLLKKLNVLPLDYTPKATEYINQMINFINKLINTGYAYKNDSGVYFRVSKIADFGVLSNRKLEENDEAFRVKVDETKENRADFALWKLSTNGINFSSPFGNGRPGWHTECVCMSNDIFKTELDIHGGGIDLIFPHHENEIAQNEAYNHTPLSKYWIHVNFLNMGDTKMSKSLGNVEYAKDIVKKYGGLSLRLFLLSTNYRSPITYSSELIIEAANKMNSINKTLKNKLLLIKSDKSLYESYLSSAIDEKYFSSFIAELNNDMNTANAISIIYELLKLLQSRVINNDTFKYLKTIIKCLTVLGLYKKVVITKEILSLYEKYNELRSNKEYEKSDEIRQILIKKNYL